MSLPKFLPAVKQPQQITFTVPETWEDMANRPDLIEVVKGHIAKVGLVGYEKEGLLVYLGGSSRKLTKPLSLVIKGESNSGKDKVQRTPIELMPPEDVLDFMEMTRKAFYYLPEGADPETYMAHKTYLGGERSHEETPEQRDNTKALRMMLSHGYVSQKGVKDLSGREVRILGPLNYSETTTKKSIFNEDANRVIQIALDMPFNQRRNVLYEMCRNYGEDKAKVEEERETVRELHRELGVTGRPLS
jgi:hypothetical protein